MEVLTTETRDQHNLEHLLRRSDFVSIHLPLTTGTRNLIGADAFALMKPTAILINTARGPIVDREALAQALHTGQIAGAALDVTNPEPLPKDDPLWQAPNLLVVPHIGSATWSARERMTEIAVENILAGLEGRPLPYQVPGSAVRLIVRIAVVDVGTNTTRLYLAEVTDGQVTAELRASAA